MTDYINLINTSRLMFYNKQNQNRQKPLLFYPPLNIKDTRN